MKKQTITDINYEKSNYEKSIHWKKIIKITNSEKYKNIDVKKL